MQIIFQDPFASLNPRMRVFEILEEGLLALRPGHRRDGAARARSSALVEQVGLRRDALERYPHEFSGGQRQRIAIARALAVRAAADRLRRADLGARRLGAGADPQPAAANCSASSACRYLFITHNIGVVEYLADDVAVMQRGRIEEAGPAAVLEHPPRTPAPAGRRAANRIVVLDAGSRPRCVRRTQHAALLHAQRARLRVWGLPQSSMHRYKRDFREAPRKPA